MLSRLRARLTYANVVAMLALFLALGGGAYAAVTLPKNSVKAKQIAPGAVRTSEIKNNAAKGRDIDESSLGTVPSATRAATATNADRATSADRAANADHATSADGATNATHAGSADTVGGVTAVGFSYQTAASGATATLLSRNGLTVTATCSTGRVDATTSVDNAYISSSWVRGTNLPERATNTDFDTTETFMANTSTGAETGSIEYVRPGGQRVSVSLQADMAAACTVSGHAFSSG
jgi:hypothetical protein